MLGFALILAVGALIILALYVKVLSLDGKLRQLGERLGTLERDRGAARAPGITPVAARAAEAIQVTAAPTAPPPAVPAPPVPAPAFAPEPALDIPAGQERPTPPTPAVHSTPATPTPESAPPPVETGLSPLWRTVPSLSPPPPSRTRGEWEALIGGKLLNRIGALALIIGVGFFLKHAIDNDWISEGARVLIGAAVGFACLAGAERARRKGYQIFSQGLVGAGIAILYLAVYASFNFYRLVSLPVAFVMMSAVTIIAFLEAFRNDSFPVSLLGLIGGLLTPVLLSTDRPNEVGLFTYLLILNLGIVMVMLRNQEWDTLGPVSLGGTYALFFSWFASYYDTRHTVSALAFLTLLWAVYHGLDIFRVATARGHREDFHRLVAWFHAAAAFGALYGICAPHGDSRTALAATVAAILYVGSAFFVLRRRSEAHGAVIGFTVAAASFLGTAIALEYESFTIVCLWTFEAFLLVLLGTKYRRRYFFIIGLCLLGVTTITLLALDGSLFAPSPEQHTPILNLRALTYVLLAAAGGVTAHLIRRATPGTSTVLSDALHTGWILLIFVLLTVETNDLFRSWMVHAGDRTAGTLAFARLMVMAMVWSLYGLVLVRSARHTAIAPVAFCGVAATFAAVCLAAIRGIAFESLDDFTPVFNVRVYALLCVAGVVFIETLWLEKSRVRSAWLPEFREAELILGIALLLVLCTGETRDIFEKAISVPQHTVLEECTGDSAGSASLEETDRLENLKQLSLSGVWLLFSIVVMVYGIWRRTRILRLLAIVLFGVTILKIFIYDLSFLETLYRIFSFVGLGLILLAVSYLYQRYREVIVGSSETTET